MTLQVNNATTIPQGILQSRQAVSCFLDSQCGAKEFCLHPALNAAAAGRCTACWRCCLFPAAYGRCPGRCNCRPGAPCDSRLGCGSGLFCSIADPLAVATCQRCDACTSDAHELGGSCAAPCPSADMRGAGALPQPGPQRFLLLAFLAAEISNRTNPLPDTLRADEVAAWLAAQGLDGPSVELTLGRLLDTSGAGAEPGANAGYSEASGLLSTKDWMARVSRSPSLALTCPAFDPALPPSRQPRLAAPGCFCNATRGAASFRCPPGSRCSRAAFRGLDVEALDAPAGQLMRAVCVACGPGQYCPEGTYVQEDPALAEPSELDCPAGSVCPDPATRLDCPPGAFCGPRTTRPLTCDYDQLLLDDPTRLLPREPESVLTRLRDRHEPLRGNYCPARATRPSELCGPGFYCPNASARLLCPAGHFCKAQSTSPWRCPPLTPCPEGTAVPRMSYMALVIAGAVLAGLPLLHLLLRRLDSSLQVEAEEREQEGGGEGGAAGRRDVWAAAASRVTFRLLSSVKLGGSPSLEARYRGFGCVAPPVTLEFTELGLRLRGRSGKARSILAGVSGSFAPRRLNAILGPSGCGKTTFLNVLCGKTSAGQMTGQVRVNGRHIPVARLQRIMGFVPQDDILHEDLTVRENLLFSARLRLPADAGSQRRRHVVADAVEALGLGGVQHYRVGSVERRGVSGGQRKRVNIGVELVAMPSLLLLDEPTSGLDATTSADILNSLSDMAALGMNLIMVIHQPRFSCFTMFDQVLLLGGGGRTVYLGSPSAAVLYFTQYLGYEMLENENPSDVLMDIIAGKLQCAGDPKLKTCGQLVQRWAHGGAAWVEALEAINPTMTTKMSDVDPAIVSAIEEQLEALAPADSDRDAISAQQLVKLFRWLGQDISLEDAVLLIRKLHASAPARVAAGHAAAPAVGAGASGSECGAEAAGLTLSKAQLLAAFRGAREREREDEGEEAAAAPGLRRQATTRIRTSHFTLPDTPHSPQQQPHLLLPQQQPQALGHSASQRLPSPPPQCSETDSFHPVSPELMVLGTDAEMDWHADRALRGTTTLVNGHGSWAAGEAGDGRGSAMRRKTLKPETLFAAVGGGGAYDSNVPRLPVAPGLAASSLAAMEALSRADVPLPPLPRRAADAGTTRDGDAAIGGRVLRKGLSRSHRRSTTYAAIAAYVHTFNALSAAAVGDGVGVGGGGARAASVSAAAVAAARRASAADACGGDSDEPGWGAAGGGNGGGGSAGAVLPIGRQRGRAGTDGGDGAAAAEEDEKDIDSLPPLLRQLLARSTGNGGKGGGGDAAVQLAAPQDVARDADEVEAGACEEFVTLVLGDPEGPPTSPPRHYLPESSPQQGPGQHGTRERSSWGPAHAPSPAPLRPSRASAAALRKGPLLGRSEVNGIQDAAKSPEGVQQPGAATPGAEVCPEGSDAAMPKHRRRRPPSLHGVGWDAADGGGNRGGDGGGRQLAAANDEERDALPPLLSPLSPQRYRSTRFAAIGRGGASAPLSPPPPFARAHSTPGLAAPAESHHHAGASPELAVDAAAGNGKAYGCGLGSCNGGAELATSSSDVLQPASASNPARTATGAGGSVRTASEAGHTAVVGLEEAVEAGDGVQHRDRASAGGARGGAVGPRSGFLYGSSGPGSPAAAGLTGSGALGGTAQRKRGQSSMLQAPHTGTGGALPPAGSRSTPASPRGGALLSPRGGVGPRRSRKDTLYVNSLLSNALVGAWAATQSSPSGRSHPDTPSSRLPALTHTGSGLGTAPEGDERFTRSNTSTALASPGGSSRVPNGVHRSGSLPVNGLNNGSGGGAEGGEGGGSDAGPGSGGSVLGQGLMAKAPSIRPDAGQALEEALTSRRHQGFLGQLGFLLRRGGIKLVRSFWPMRAVDAALQLAAAFVVGLVHGTDWGLTSVPGNTVMCMVCLGVLSCVTHLRTFSSNRVLLWREAACGLSLPAHFLAHNALDCAWVLLAPALSLGPYYFLTLPRMAFGELYAAGLGVCWWCSGLAYLVSAALPPSSVLMAGVFASLIAGAFLHGLAPSLASARGTLLEGVLGLSYNRWAVEVVALGEMRHYEPDMRTTLVSLARATGLCGADRLPLLEGGGRGGVSAEEAVSFLQLQSTFSLAACGRYRAVGFGALAGLGLGFRALAFLLLRRACRARR